jgi:WD40 repeat protein
MPLWDVQTGAEHAALDEPLNTVWRIAFSPDGQLLAALSSENRLLLWSLAPG